MIVLKVGFFEKKKFKVIPTDISTIFEHKTDGGFGVLGAIRN
jgi:hypothetical protein